MAQFIYTMNRVGKVVPPKRVILRDISLTFFPGAKIGVLGLNGSGKSTLLRIMAGIDKEFEGEARPQPGIKIGFLPQEPQLDATKDVRGNVEVAVQHIKDALAGLDAVYAAYAEPDADFDKIAAEQARLEAVIQAADGHNLERQLEVAADALRLPPWDADVTQDLRRRTAPRRAVPVAAVEARHAAARRAHQPPRRRVGALARTLPREYPGTVIAVTHDRYFLDNVAGWILELDRGHGIPWQGNYSSWLEQKEARLKVEEQQQDALKKMLARELEWVRQNPKARQAKSKARMQRFEELQSREFQERNETNEIYIPPGPRLGELVIEAKGLSKAYGEKLLFDNLNFNLPQGGIVGIIGPNGAGKTTLVPHPDRQGNRRTAAKYASGLRCSSLTSTSRGNRSTTRKRSWQEISSGLDMIKVGNYETPSRAYVGRFNFRGTQQQQSIGELSGGERNRVHLAKVLKEGGNVHPARRTDQRPRRRNAARARRSAAELPGLRRRHLARSLVPRSHRHPHPRVRGQQRSDLVRRQLFRVRRGPQEAPGRRRRAAAPRPLSQPARLMELIASTAPR